MAEVQIRDILVGFGNLYYADYGTELPDMSVGEVDKLEEHFDTAPDWNYLGATQEGVELSYAPEYGEVEVDQLGDAAVMFFERANVMMNTQLAEATLENLLVAWGFEDSFLEQDVDNSVSTFSIGVPGQDPVERTVAVLGKGAAADAGERRDRVYHGRRVLSVEGSSLALRRSENTAYDVSFRLLADPTSAGSEYGVIIDRIPGQADGV